MGNVGRGDQIVGVIRNFKLPKDVRNGTTEARFTRLGDHGVGPVYTLGVPALSTQGGGKGSGAAPQIQGPFTLRIP